MSLRIFYICLLVLFVSCTHTVSIKNEKKGKLTAGYQLVVSAEKKILLDNNSAPKPPYMQMITGESGEQILTFLNPYKNGIYFYDYEKEILIKTIEYEREGPDAILRLDGYYIKNMDSIYVYNLPMIEVALTDSSGYVKQRISLRNNRDDREWPRYYPQYFFSTVNPLIEIKGKLILTGSAPFGVADSSISKFQFTSYIDLKSGDVEFMHTYPGELYGSNTQWQDMFFTQAFRALLPNEDFVYSFPVSHNVYITSFGKNEYNTVYAGSNFAETIRSINNNRSRIPTEEIVSHILKHDLYTSIIYDPYRLVYYRFMLQGHRDATINTTIKQKPVSVIIMDEQFNYMGEAVLGTGDKWNWENSFVTSEGLMIEYFDPDLDSLEEYLTFKILTIEKL